MDIISEQSEFRDEIKLQTKQMRLTDSTRRQYADRIRQFCIGLMRITLLAWKEAAIISYHQYFQYLTL